MAIILHLVLAIVSDSLFFGVVRGMMSLVVVVMITLQLALLH